MGIVRSDYEGSSQRKIMGGKPAPRINHPISILWILPVLGETAEMERREVEENMSAERKKHNHNGIENKGKSSGKKEDKGGDWLVHILSQEIVLAMFSTKLTAEL